MKNVVKMIVNISLGVILLLILASVVGRMNRSMEIESNLSSVVEETVENMTVTLKYDVKNSREVCADFVENLIERLDGKVIDMKVEVKKVDLEKGLLAVEVTEKFQHPNGRMGTISDNRVVILNQLEVPERKECVVKFYLSKKDMEEGINCYKCYHLYEEDKIQVPIVPEKQGAVFDGWKDCNDYMADFSIPVQENISYYAAWK